MGCPLSGALTSWKGSQRPEGACGKNVQVRTRTVLEGKHSAVARVTREGLTSRRWDSGKASKYIICDLERWAERKGLPWEGAPQRPRFQGDLRKQKTMGVC